MAHVNIALALDGMDDCSARKIFHELKNVIDMVKVSDLVDRYGAAIIREFAAHKPVFVDTKLDDTPTTIMNRGNVYCEAGASFFSVHAKEKALKAATLITAGTDTEIIAVTELTSENKAEISRKVLAKAQLAMQCGVQFITCSGHEASCLRGSLNYYNMHLFIPGIVPTWAAKPTGQERTADHRDVMKQSEGRDCTLVIGRVITQARTYGSKPIDVVCRIRQELAAILPPGSIANKLA